MKYIKLNDYLFFEIFTLRQNMNSLTKDGIVKLGNE